MKHKSRAMSCAIATAFLVVTATAASLSGNVTDTSQSSQQVNTAVVAEKETVEIKTTTENTEAKQTKEAPDSAWVDKAMANVEEALNVRTEASKEADLTGKLYKGSRADVLEYGDEWTKIESGNVNGYVKTEYLVFGDDAKALAAEVCKTYATCTTETLYVRSTADASTKDNVVEYLGRDEKLPVDTATTAPEGWVAVIYDGKTAYVNANFVTVGYDFTKALTIEEEQAIEKAEAAKKAKATSKSSSSSKTSSSSKPSSSSSSSGSSYSVSDVELLAALIYCEAGGECYEGQLAVGAVVMNRVESGSYPNTISGVIYQSGQFSPAASGKLARALANGNYCWSAAEAAMAGQDNTGGALHFNAGYGQGIQIGNQHFW